MSKAAVGNAPSGPLKLCSTVSFLPASLNSTPQPSGLQLVLPPSSVVPYSAPLASMISPPKGSAPSCPPVKRCSTVSFFPLSLNTTPQPVASLPGNLCRQTRWCRKDRHSHP